MRFLCVRCKKVYSIAIYCTYNINIVYLDILFLYIIHKTMTGFRPCNLHGGFCKSVSSVLSGKPGGGQNKVHWSRLWIVIPS